MTYPRRLRRPQVCQSNRQRLEGLALNDCFGAPCANDTVTNSVEPKHLECLKERIDEPYVTNTLPPVDGELFGSIDRGGGRRQDLADPIGGKLERARLGQGGHALATPTGDIGDEHVSMQVKLGLIEDDPSTGTATTAVERPIELCSKARGSTSVVRRRTRARDQLAVEELCHEICGDLSEVIVCRATPGGISHHGEFSSIATA